MQIGVDIGGTFTDIVALDGQGRLVLTKVPTTPKDLLEGVAVAVRRVLAQAGAPASTVERFIHGTTIATNAVLEQKGAVTAMLTTEGFEDVLELGRQKRSRMYDLDMDPETPTFVAPRRRRRGIRERLDARGGVLVPLDEEQVRRQVAALQRDGAQAIAVCYLFSFVNPAHERRTREICREVAPEISVSLSSEVDPTFREYERFCITAFDAYLGPVVKRYLAGLAETLRGLGVPGVPLVMRSRGGLVSAGLAARQPVTLFLSGPAAGVVGARFAAERSEVRDFVSLDMGGTSNDVAVVRGGKPLITSSGFIGPYPVRAPMVDVNTIGAGGGSIAWIDGAGGLRVGPVSAGADPGPACYGRGGHQATVTDANLLLGYLDPERFADGLMTLDRAAAERAVGAVADKLGLETIAAAAGIHRVINARMADQIRLVTIKRGYDPREFALVVLGGAGPVHGVALAEEMGMAEVIVPEAPGVLAAFGLLAAAIEHHHARTLHSRVGQAYELEVAIEAPTSQTRVASAARGFHETHERVYGYARAQQPVELVNFSAVHRYPLPRPVLSPPASAVGAVGDARIGERRVYFAPAGFVPTALYDRARLPRGSRLAGPAIVEQADSTSVIPPGHLALVEASGNLRIRRA